MTLWASLVLVLIASLAFGVVYLAGGLVLRNTLKGYLMSAVEQNTNKINWGTAQEDTEANIYIAYGDGYLEIDRDFLDVINDVYAALYTSGGEMLYGEDPVARHTQDRGFTQTELWEITVDGIRYDMYDRRLPQELPDGQSLWIRGCVSEAGVRAQLRETARISLILMPVVIALCVLSGYLLTGRMLAPVRDMEKSAAAISRGDDLKARIPVSGSDEIGRLGTVFNGMLGRLEASFEAERQFTSDASHELRTPASVIMAQTEYTLEKDRSPGEYREALEVIQRQGRRMSALIGDMLDYSRLDRRPEDYPMTEVDLSAIAADCAEQMDMTADRGIGVSADVIPGVAVRGNQLLLERMITNLTGNAVRYGRDGGYVKVGVKRTEDGCPLLFVEDDGIGIGSEEQEKIFQRFYRSDASRSLPGTGLGLSMVKKIADMHGAGLSLDSEPGKGSTFFIKFPPV